ncbi:hypothetical protein DSECCO2_577130 [anaerobic digester metagenome]|jgi:spore cortex formation protein SpoVR/YcgB (stage V sporulation)|uniref:hypothetical protein n=1 Tax=Methanoculleus sp. TaxID=90427 RepID=UPI000A701C74|nr:hypothetical protein [Methanoculleus sp.]HNT09064.1 hypothetical protein [Methanoculleus sp.]HPX74011.1 hypothetical protein [Methanoregulaceae archaeon]
MTPAVTIDELYLEIKMIQETVVRREDLEALLDTIEILSNPETIEQRFRRAKKISLPDERNILNRRPPR